MLNLYFIVWYDNAVFPDVWNCNISHLPSAVRLNGKEVTHKMYTLAFNRQRWRFT